MAKLGAFYALCPLIDNKSLFGVSQDSEEGVVITTLGMNMAGRYKVSNQKQISCWRTKDKFSSPVIYDIISSKYVAVFNKSFIRMWDKEVNLDKVKKYKFKIPIHTLFSKNGQSYVVFQNGALYTLKDALEGNKTLNPKIPDVEQIEDILYEQIDDELYYGTIVKSKETYLYWTIFENRRAKFKKIKLEREEFTLAGCVFHKLESKMNLLTLWSDGAMFSCPLDNIDSDSTEDGVGKLFSTIESVSTKYPVSMVSLNGNHLALYGANFNEEGAVFVIYNTQFRVMQSNQPFKLFTNNARMWPIANAVFLPVGQNLAVIPFQLETASLADLVERFTVGPDDLERLPILEVGTDGGCKPREQKLPRRLADKVDEMVKRGLPESTMIEWLLPDIFENQDIELLSLCIEHFTDIPERLLSKILKYLLDLDGHCFKGSDLVIEGMPPDFRPSEVFFDGVPPVLQPSGKTKLIDRILCRPFCERLLIPHLRSDLSISHVAALMRYIYLVWADLEMVLPGLGAIDTETRLAEWAAVLFDANFVKMTLAKDQSIKETLELMAKLTQKINNTNKNLCVTRALLQKVSKRKPVTRDAYNSSSRYSVEQMILY